VSEAISDVVWPLGGRPATESAAERGNNGLSGARVAFAWDYLFRGDQMWALVQEELRRRWPDITFVGPDEFGNFHDKFNTDVTGERLKSRMDALRIDAAVIGVGA
jgi:hypothetical protein